MLKTVSPGSRGRIVYAVGSLLAAVAVGLGLWDLLVERDSGANWFWQVIFPAALLILMLALYIRSPRT